MGSGSRTLLGIVLLVALVVAGAGGAGADAGRSAGPAVASPAPSTGSLASQVRVASAANNPPTADAGLNHSAESGERVPLRGGGTDPDGDKIYFNWTQLSGPDVEIKFDDENWAVFDAPYVSEETTLRFELTVTDEHGLSDSDTVVITILPAETPTPTPTPTPTATPTPTPTATPTPTPTLTPTATPTPTPTSTPTPTLTTGAGGGDGDGNARSLLPFVAAGFVLVTGLAGGAWWLHNHDLDDGDGPDETPPQPGGGDAPGGTQAQSGGGHGAQGSPPPQSGGGGPGDAPAQSGGGPQGAPPPGPGRSPGDPSPQPGGGNGGRVGGGGDPVTSSEWPPSTDSGSASASAADGQGATDREDGPDGDAGAAGQGDGRAGDSGAEGAAGANGPVPAGAPNRAVDDGQSPPDLPVSSPVPEGLSVEYERLTEMEHVGGGGNADVVRALYPTESGDVPLAIKEPRLSGTIYAETIERILDEAETWDRLDDHDHIVDIVDYGSQPVPWIAMEYMDGGHLGERIGAMSHRQSLWTALAVTKAVRYAHRQGVAHLDLKPENVLFRSVEGAWDVPEVADWGLSKQLLTHSKSVEGISYQYAAPEQFDDDYGATDDITDVYQLGAMFYEQFTGRPPFEGQPTQVMHATLNDRPVPPSERNPSLPPELDEIILTALATEKADRYDTVIYLRDTLRELYERA